MQSARSLIEKLIDKGTAFGDSIKLARMETLSRPPSVIIGDI